MNTNVSALNQSYAKQKINWFSSTPFFIMHVAVFGVLFFPFEWKLLSLSVAYYYLRMFGITAGYHRYFSHKSFKTSRLFQFILALVGTLSVQKGVLWWASWHRHHHLHSDEHQDIHSPKHGFWWSHVGWILASDYEKTEQKLIPDFNRFPELRWLNTYWIIPPVLSALAILTLWGWPGFFWIFVLSTVILWHGTFTINSLGHIFGTQRYKTKDDSKNNFFLSLLTMGEGWHNNHHAYMNSARQGFFWWEVDFSYYILKVLNYFGIVWDLKAPPSHENLIGAHK